MSWIKKQTRAEDCKVHDNLKYHNLRDYNPEPKFYVLIEINHETKMIHLGIVDSKTHIITEEYIADTPQKIYYNMALRKDIEMLPEHRSYIAKELSRAKGCLETGKKYLQDSCWEEEHNWKLYNETNLRCENCHKLKLNEVK